MKPNKSKIKPNKNTMKPTKSKIKFSKTGILILLIPLALMLLLLPVLPDKIPMQLNTSGDASWYLDKNLSFIIGLCPFMLYILAKINSKKE
ncbi:DUF1648 domain-containing protein [Clostridium vincentii]|uniref:DUF1648 domain-containing protein n=1 Tax=Clostridium vincentii TaxID=52704 RepID=A0A2T0BAX3_9CLOT|nr:DUF1648 domain-containing protein [Clostridium vincentii]PRR81056.1 hypothetical protein CLVI_28140 [Clostridium vincentii]